MAYIDLISLIEFSELTKTKSEIYLYYTHALNQSDITIVHRDWHRVSANISNVKRKRKPGT